jgi:hypothetical protein
VTAPVAPLLSEKVDPFIVAESIASENRAVTAILSGTDDAPDEGIVDDTWGGVESGELPVVKLHSKLFAIAFPDRSLTPVVIVAV